MHKNKTPPKFNRELKADIRGVAEARVKDFVQVIVFPDAVNSIADVAGDLVGKLSTLEVENKNGEVYAFDKFYDYLLRELLRQLRAELKKNNAR